ncbi:MAG: hypothetical protein AAF570_23135, partial [Bacteroidota bacterium]
MKPEDQEYHDEMGLPEEMKAALRAAMDVDVPVDGATRAVARVQAFAKRRAVMRQRRRRVLRWLVGMQVAATALIVTLALLPKMNPGPVEPLNWRWLLSPGPAAALAGA